MIYKLPDAFLIQYDAIDQEHAEVVALINRLHADCAGNRLVEFEELLGDLIACLMRHFTHEESHMRDLEYPGLDWHVAHHSESIDKARRIFQISIRDGFIDEMTVGKFFHEIVQDIVQADLQFRAFLEDKMLV